MRDLFGSCMLAKLDYDEATIWHSALEHCRGVYGLSNGPQSFGTLGKR